MACEFGLSLEGDDAEYLRRAADAAFEELARLEQLLSRFIPTSDVSQINSATADRPVMVAAETVECLELAAQLWCETRGAFDITFGSVPDWAASSSGMDQIQLEGLRRTVRRRTSAVFVDLGGVGKGYALDRLAELLRGWGIRRALLDSGQSTALAVGRGWTVALRDPSDQQSVLGHAVLSDFALAGSGVQLHGQHIVDPQTRQPAGVREAAWAAAATAAVADALSTAFMVMSEQEIRQYCAAKAGTAAVLLVGPGRLVRVGAESGGCVLRMGANGLGAGA